MPDGDAYMRAALAHGYGPPSAIALVTDAPMPTPTKKQLLVRVHSTTVNPADCKQRSGNLQLVMSHKFPVAFGQDFSGIVVTAPPTSRYKAGDEVYGCTAPRNGCGAEYVAVNENECALKPKSLQWDVAAAIPTAACTAYRGVVTLGRATEGMRVLVHGATGSVGSAMVQIARARGCEVWGTCSPKNRAYLQSLGVVAALDYSRPLADELSSAPDTPPDVRFDLVLDAVGGDDLYSASLPYLAARSGRYLSAVGPVRHGGSERITVGTLLFTTRTLVPRLFNRAYALFLSFDVSDLNQPELIEMLTTADQKGRRVEMRVDPEPFELATLASAHEKCETNHSDGKIVVRVTADPSSWPEVGTGS